MDEAALHSAIHALRSASAYHAAETLRRNTPGGAAAMAVAPYGSVEHGSLRLLVNTWETISYWLNKKMEAKEVAEVHNIFEVLPLGHMYYQLTPAIALLKLTESDKICVNFDYQAGKYATWLAGYSDLSYQTGAQGGMHACFG